MIRVWSHSLVSNGMGVSVDAGVVFAYAKEFKENKIELLELIKKIEKGARDG